MTRPKTGVSCEICHIQQEPGRIHPRPSALLKGVTLFVCNKCAEEKKEPRSFVVIAAKKYGQKAVEDYIKNHRYNGTVITAKEIIRPIET